MWHKGAARRVGEEGVSAVPDGGSEKGGKTRLVAEVQLLVVQICVAEVEQQGGRAYFVVRVRSE